MVIAMSQITQVTRVSLAPVRWGFSAFFARHPATHQSEQRHQSEHWQVAHCETSDQRVRRSAVIVATLCAALVVSSCNVYDISLLGADQPNAGGSAGGTIFAGSGASTSGGGSGSADSSAGSVGDAATGVGLGGADAGGSPGTPAGSGGMPSAAGGAGGAGGAAAAGGPADGMGSVQLSVIDDMEMTDQYIPTADRRIGFWSLSNDGKGMQTPATMVMSTIPNGRGTSLHALHTTTTGFKADPIIGVDLNRKNASARATYDASAYRAVHFFAKVEMGSATAVHFAILDKHTDPGGMLCCPSKTTCAGTENISSGTAQPSGLPLYKPTDPVSRSAMAAFAIRP